MLYNGVMQGRDLKKMLDKVRDDIQDEVSYMADSPHTTECSVKVKPSGEAE